ncbi:hypothetical protein N474_06670 [Pseudoalteromonas luteoviolacea CPMOR-2]|uniref:O-antigen polysaccharide polymerase Wzy n=1 Tax=Pseudoalteromonas luteoviolacea DSM 6061 TaxID=1365250 RepID=A0A161ZX37_9GAMM|nr:O-antigen polysaccharide polymerase Wzy [Pseudoalteromonas luteoviolacea]KZN37375.1 hypothetical protein N475_16925 [Pseudoalteromonas luteoviolacea DSM 6061]KZN59372.1 hypothetical protein N474_06670 [Pseudoalteromonas luteoviolacea CPMOR-2]MBE0387395.1 hypothetical protein [Pseudoalteromonas luteoviolacea DSM 6061]
MLHIRSIFLDAVILLSTIAMFFAFSIGYSVDILVTFFVLTVTYIRSVCTALKLGGTAGLYFIFLGCFFIFILGGRYFGFSNINYAHTVAGVYIIDDYLVSKSFMFYAFVLSLINASYQAFYSRLQDVKKDTLSFDQFSFDMGRVCFLLFLPGTMIKFYMEFKFISEFGYYAYYSEGVSAPFWVDVSRYLFVISFAILVSANAAWPRVKIYFILFFLFAIAFLLLGVRSSFVLYSSVIYFIYYNCYSNKAPKITTLFFAFVLMISLLLFVQFYRQGWHFELSDNNLLSYFFISQSNSFYILPFTMENLDKFTSQFSVFAPLSPESLLYRSQNMERLNELGLLGDVISYNVLGDEYFSQGMGIGGNFAAELFQSGVIVSIILCIFIGKVMSFFQLNVSNYRYLLMISIIIISNVAYMGRSSLFRNFSLFLILTVVFLIIYILRVAMKKAKEKEVSDKQVL